MSDKPTCPTCGSDDPKVLRHRHAEEGAWASDDECSVWTRRQYCPDNFHGVRPLYKAYPTPTPVSDDAVREVAELRDDIVRLWNRVNGDYQNGRADDDLWTLVYVLRTHSLATLEAAIHQRDERIGELEAEHRACRTYVMGVDVAGEPEADDELPWMSPEEAKRAQAAFTAILRNIFIKARQRGHYPADPLLEAVEQADRLLDAEKKKQAAE